MKLRIRGDTVRLRLTQGEVQRLVETGKVEEATPFAGGRTFAYALVASGDGVTARLESPFRLEVRVAAEIARSWASGDDVGIEATEATGDGRTLRILVEKDYACLKTRPGEDDADAFPHPKA